MKASNYLFCGDFYDICFPSCCKHNLHRDNINSSDAIEYPGRKQENINFFSLKFDLFIILGAHLLTLSVLNFLLGLDQINSVVEKCYCMFFFLNFITSHHNY